MHGLLDPRDPLARDAALDWLAFQRLYALAPVRGLEILARGCAPGWFRRAAGSPRLRFDVERAARVVGACGARVLPFGAPGYPEALSTLVDAPPVLLVRGAVEDLSRPSVAIVGSRAPTAAAVAIARELAARFARAGLVVVSGLARGIDAAAHVAALEAGGRTVAVSACGPERIYPAAHFALARRIEAQGALVTEFPPGTPPRGPYFPLRNRVISALSRAVVVVEARERSGSLVTAAHAAEQGRDVFAAPGPLGEPACAGTNRLLWQGAHVLLSAADVLQAIGIHPDAGAAPAAEASPPCVVLRSLRRSPATRDELARSLGVAPEALAQELLDLVLAGRVVEDRDGRLRAVGSGQARPL